MIHVIVVAALSAAYLLMVLMCVCKRESVLAVRVRTERILATLDMEEYEYEQSSPIPPTANPDVSGLARAMRNAGNDDGTHPLAG